MNNIKKYTIFGNPVEHSKSPDMYNEGFNFLNINAKYIKTFLMDGYNLKSDFLDGKYSGANITVPYKEIAFKQSDEVVGLANQIGSVNTYINKNGKIIGYNTDAPGFLKAIEDFGNIKTVLILGAGGTARAISVALKSKGINVIVLNRSKNKLEYFNNIGCKIFSWDDFKLSKYDLVVNANSAGLNDDNYPIKKEILNQIIQNTTYCFDCIYGKITPFLSVANNYNKIYKDGTDMLLYQGVFALEYFIGKKVDLDTIEIMRKQIY